MRRFSTILCAILVCSVAAYAQPVTLIKDINPGEEGCIPSNFGAPTTTPNIAVGDTYFFAADDGEHGTELWKSDGTEAGTVLVKDINPGSEGSDPYAFHVLNDTLFFFAETPGFGTEVWYSDGTEAGTNILRDIRPGGNSGISFASVMTVAGDLLFFTANTPETDRELWRSDGTPEGTMLVKDIYEGSISSGVQAPYGWNGILYFSANESINDGNELWRSDGTAEGTFMLKNIHEADGFGSRPSKFQAAGDLLYFWAESENTGVELWRTDGTEAGTQLVKDILEGSPSALNDDDYELYPLGEQLLFVAALGGGDRGLFITDGSEANTVELAVFNGSFALPFGFEAFDEEVYFFAGSSPESGLWKTDGTPEGTVYIEDFFPSSFGTYVSDITNYKDRLIVNASLSGGAGSELYESNATATAFSLVQEINTGFGVDSEPRNVRVVGEQLFFAADDGDIGYEFYVYKAEPLPLTANITETASNPCHDDSVAEISVSVQGGTPPYSYAWTPDSLQGPAATNLPPGDYAVTVTDDLGNAIELSIEIGPAPLELTLSQIGPEDEGQANGAILLTLDGGTPPYTFDWDPEIPPGEDPLRPMGLTAGEYSLTVTDNNGCTTSGSYVVDLITGTQELQVEWLSSIHPNPTDEVLFLTLKTAAEPEQITMYNTNGQLVLSRTFINRIDISGLPSGVYWLKIQGAAGVQILEVIKR
jgi:ELWxxDGT repeat protein